jgi:hypothetical protein
MVKLLDTITLHMFAAKSPYWPHRTCCFPDDVMMNKLQWMHSLATIVSIGHMCPMRANNHSCLACGHVSGRPPTAKYNDGILMRLLSNNTS